MTVAMATVITRSGTPTAIAIIVTLFLRDGGVAMSPNLSGKLLKINRSTKGTVKYHQPFTRLSPRHQA